MIAFLFLLCASFSSTTRNLNLDETTFGKLLFGFGFGLIAMNTSARQLCLSIHLLIDLFTYSLTGYLVFVGLKDVGIYRISGLSSEIQRLKKVFNKSKHGSVWFFYSA